MAGWGMWMFKSGGNAQEGADYLRMCHEKAVRSMMEEMVKTQDYNEVSAVPLDRLIALIRGAGSAPVLPSLSGDRRARRSVGRSVP